MRTIARTLRSIDWSGAAERSRAKAKIKSDLNRGSGAIELRRGESNGKEVSRIEGRCSEANNQVVKA